MTPVQFIQRRFPTSNLQDTSIRSHLGSFGITGLTGMQKIGTLSGGQKSRVAFAVLSMLQPHILLLDEVCLPFPRAPPDTSAVESPRYRGYRRFDCSLQHFQGRHHPRQP